MPRRDISGYAKWPPAALAGQTFAFGIEDFEMAHAAFSHGIFHGGLYHSDSISHATAKADG